MYWLDSKDYPNVTHSSKTEFITSRSEYSSESMEQCTSGKLYLRASSKNFEFSDNILFAYLHQAIGIKINEW